MYRSRNVFHVNTLFCIRGCDKQGHVTSSLQGRVAQYVRKSTFILRVSFTVNEREKFNNHSCQLTLECRFCPSAV